MKRYNIFDLTLSSGGTKYQVAMGIVAKSRKAAVKYFRENYNYDPRHDYYIVLCECQP